MNLVDIFLGLIILVSIYGGYKKGFILGAVDLLTLALGLVFAFWSSRYLAAFFEKYISSIGVWTHPLSFIIAYFIARGILSALTARIFKELPDTSHKHFTNKTLGILPGAVNGTLTAAILGALLMGFPLFDELSSKARESRIVTALTPSMEWAEDKFAPVFDEAINQSINKLTLKPGTTRNVPLHFTVAAPRTRQDLEARMLIMINEERQKAGLRPLEGDPEMQQVARDHSKDMLSTLR